MNCGCNSTPTTPTSANTPNLLFTLSAPVRYEGDALEPFLSWTLAETDLDVRFEYVFRDTFEFTTGEQYQHARIEVATDAEGAGLTRAGADKLRVVPLLSDALTTVHINAPVAKGLYWRIVAVCPGTQEELEDTDHSLLEYSSLTLTPSATPVTPSTPSCDCACDPCAPSTHCHVPPPMPVVVVPGVNNTLPACEGPNTFEPISSFTVPALEASGPLRVCDPAKYPVGTCVFLSDGTTSATLRVVSRDLGAKTIQLENYGAPGSAAAGTVFGATAVVSPLGPCPTVAAESCARAGWELGEAFTPLAATVDTDIVVEPCMDVVVGQNLFIEGAGWFTVKSIDAVTEESSSFTVWTHTLLPGVTAGTTVIASGSYVIADEPQAAFTPTSGTISMIVEHDVDKGALAGAGSVSANSTPLVLPWSANLMIAPNVSANALSATAGIRFDYGIWYSDDSGATWADSTVSCPAWGGEPHDPQTIPFTLSLPAGTYLFRFRMDTSGAYTYPVVAYTNIHILATRTTASVS